MLPYVPWKSCLSFKDSILDGCDFLFQSSSKIVGRPWLQCLLQQWLLPWSGLLYFPSSKKRLCQTVRLHHWAGTPQPGIIALPSAFIWLFTFSLGQTQSDSNQHRINCASLHQLYKTQYAHYSRLWILVSMKLSTFSQAKWSLSIISHKWMSTQSCLIWLNNKSQTQFKGSRKPYVFILFLKRAKGGAE